MAIPELPDELIEEILSRVPVKPLIRSRRVCKTWNSLTYDPTFIKLHLQRSTKNPTHILLSFTEDLSSFGDFFYEMSVAALCSIPHLFKNPSSAIDDCFVPLNNNQFVSGSCNGLVCFDDSECLGHGLREYWVHFWNPATKVMSEDSPRLCLHSSDYKIIPSSSVKWGFGFDDSCDTYKVVAIFLDIKSRQMDVRVHCLGHTCWRKTLTCPAYPIGDERRDGKFASGTLNWLALRTFNIGYHWKSVTIDQLVIFSYDIKNESYEYLLMPNGFSEVPSVEPNLGVLKGCLCLSHDHRETHFVVWLMSEFGNEKSWTQLLNVRYDHLLPFCGSPPGIVVPLCMSENEDVMFLSSLGGLEFIVYNRIENRSKWDYDLKYYKFSHSSHEYVQSLVLPYIMN